MLEVVHPKISFQNVIPGVICNHFAIKVAIEKQFHNIICFPSPEKLKFQFDSQKE
jgi:hypothetical protein